MTLRLRIAAKSILQGYVLLTLLLILSSSRSHSQLHKIWEFSMVGDGISPLSFDIKNSPILKSFITPDGDYIVVGMIQNKPDYLNRAIYLFRYNPNGQVAWEYVYESAYDLSEITNDVTMDIFGNVIIAGKTTTHFGGGFELEETSNALLLKISPQGILIWSWESDPPAHNIPDVQESSAVTSDLEGNIYSTSLVIEESGYFSKLQKWDIFGQLIWETYLDKYFVESLELVGNKLIVICRGAPSFPYESFLYQYSLEGEFLFSNEVPKVVGIKPEFDTEGNWYLPSGLGKYRIVKLDVFGDTLWSYHKPTNLPPNVSADETIDAHSDNYGNVYITGRYYGPNYGDPLLYTSCDILTVKLNSKGDVQWENIYRYDNTNSCQIGQRVLVNETGYTFVTGYQTVRGEGSSLNTKDMVLMVYDPFGNRVDSIYYNGPGNGADNGVNIVLDNDAIYMLGWSQQVDSLFDPVVIKYSQPYTSVKDPVVQKQFSVSPNPLRSGHFMIQCDQQIESLKVIDLTGRIVYSCSLYRENPQIALDPNIPSGMYVVSITTPRGVYSKSIIVQK